ncbi:hypothetical protein AVEN_87393-1 [Araneus ventricosus]|uniref:Uncharacterized protein n=1 Tax=Araneus ventricosus TaxID=182803 RepID=A0A4Y2SKK8_ARAVE|nr:hypothetical protein AVEN_213157-1 [Araneus ventricosus]GBN88359.1 hypothetical protein AVEN_200195-1 [Araneus ventricosus]GBO23855.1 hypothetical protein AVEN_215037-1 [Araneus ventricosus]GBO23858.1 hypothetical protein AVEN_87393-1 [Araneus ventricosus]
MEKSAGTSVAGLQDSRFRYFKNRQGRLSGQVTAGKRPGCPEPLTPLEVAASPALRGKGASHGRTYGFTFYETVASMRANSFKLPLSYSRNIRTVNGSYHSTRRASEFTLCPEIIAITPISSASKKSRHPLLPRSCHQNPVSKILFFLLPKSCPLLRQALSLLYKNQMSCQAFPSSLLPEPKVKLFPLHGIETKLKLLC